MRCVLHIGPSKTGSSYIQNFLTQSADTLAALNARVIRLTQAAMFEFAVAFSHEYEARPSFVRIGVTAKNFPRKQKDLRRKIQAQIEQAAAEGIEVCIISCESISNIGTGEPRDPAVQAMKRWLQRFFDSVTVVAVCRRQDKRAVSRYKNAVKNLGSTEQNCLQTVPSLHLDRLLAPYEHFFGKGNIKPLLFPDSVEENRDLIADFCSAAGLDGLYNASLASEPPRNPAVDGRAIELIRQLNRLWPDRNPDQITIAWKRAMKILMSVSATSETKVAPSREQAQKFLEAFEDGNEAVRARYFPDRETLFHADFSSYPDKAVYPSFSQEETVRVLAQLLQDEQLERLARRGKRQS
ncbi:hypothetical protein [Leisingera sp. ANG-Vp]|uniref:hypothetical protein n=1 Tax=Leisingera sp. ANG-Vp TaxID=1577896 RepID=UPI00057ECD50|nr:hypothetical protein [Leisingera sp. ANG-Vp]KIC22541.1 hypothetical protein RA20_01305 [Leisingera sp. ANG-Vp]